MKRSLNDRFVSAVSYNGEIGFEFNLKFKDVKVWYKAVFYNFITAFVILFFPLIFIVLIIVLTIIKIIKGSSLKGVELRYEK